MRIELQVELDTARDLHRLLAEPAVDRRASPAVDIRQAARKLGVELQPVHPGQTHPLLVPFFFIDVSGDSAAATRVAELLRRLPGVEAAYVRPPNEPP